MIIYVTGGRGFLGKHLVRALRAVWQSEVVCLQGDWWLQHPKPHESGGGEPTILIHLAQPNNNSMIRANAAESNKDDIDKIQSIIGCQTYKNILFISSSYVYGIFGPDPKKESSPLVGFDEYSRLKIESERVMLKDQRTTVLRLSNIYGPGMGRETIFREAIEKFKSGILFHPRDPTVTRDFLHVDDLTSGVLKTLQKLRESNLKSRVYNFGSGRGTTIGEATSLLREIFLNLTPEQSQSPVVSTVCNSNILDIAETTAEIDWRPHINLKDGLRRLVEYYRHNDD